VNLWWTHAYLDEYTVAIRRSSVDVEIKGSGAMLGCFHFDRPASFPRTSSNATGGAYRRSCSMLPSSRNCAASYSCTRTNYHVRRHWRAGISVCRQRETTGTLHTDQIRALDLQFSVDLTNFGHCCRALWCCGIRGNICLSQRGRSGIIGLLKSRAHQPGALATTNCTPRSFSVLAMWYVAAGASTEGSGAKSCAHLSSMSVPTLPVTSGSP